MINMDEQFADFLCMSKSQKLELIDAKKSSIFMASFTDYHIPFPMLMAMVVDDLFLQAFDALHPEGKWNSAIGPKGSSCMDILVINSVHPDLALEYFKRILNIEDERKRSELISAELSLNFFDYCIEYDRIELFLLAVSRADLGYLIAVEHNQTEPDVRKNKPVGGTRQLLFPPPITALFCIARDRLVKLGDKTALLVLSALMERIYLKDIEELVTFKSTKWKGDEITSAGHALYDMASVCSKNAELTKVWMELYYYFTGVASKKTANSTDRYGSTVKVLFELETSILLRGVAAKKETREIESFPDSKWKFFIDINTKKGLVVIDPCGKHEFSLVKQFDGLDRGEHFTYSGVLYTIKHFMEDVIGVELYFDSDANKIVTFVHHEKDGKLRDLVAQALMYLSTKKIQNVPVTINLDSVERERDDKRSVKETQIPPEHRHTFGNQKVKGNEKEEKGSSFLSKESTFKNGVHTTNPFYKSRSYLNDPVSVFRNTGTVNLRQKG